MFITPPVEHHVISSPLEGHLLNDGKPMINVKIIRKLEWNGDKEGSREDVAYTDETGRFSFPVFELDLAMRGLEQFVAHTKIEVENNDTPDLIWYSSKMSTELHGETGGKLKNVICDLTNTKIVTQSTPSQILTMCKWDDMGSYTEYVEHY